MTDDLCECPICGRMHHPLHAGTPPATRAVLERIDKFITAVAPSRLTKELYSIQHEVRAVLTAPSQREPPSS